MAKLKGNGKPLVLFNVFFCFFKQKVGDLIALYSCLMNCSICRINSNKCQIKGFVPLI